MGRIAFDAEAGQVSAELARRGIAADTRVHVVVEVVDALPMAVIAQAGGAFDLIVCFITSVPRAGPDMATIAPAPGTGLKAPSVIRFDKVATLDIGVIAGKLGDAAAAWLDVQAAAFFGLFGFAAPNAPRLPSAIAARAMAPMRVMHSATKFARGAVLTQACKPAAPASTQTASRSHRSCIARFGPVVAAQPNAAMSANPPWPSPQPSPAVRERERVMLGARAPSPAMDTPSPRC